MYKPKRRKQNPNKTSAVKTEHVNSFRNQYFGGRKRVQKEGNEMFSYTQDPVYYKTIVIYVSFTD